MPVPIQTDDITIASIFGLHLQRRISISAHCDICQPENSYLQEISSIPETDILQLDIHEVSYQNWTEQNPLSLIWSSGAYWTHLLAFASRQMMSPSPHGRCMLLSVHHQKGIKTDAHFLSFPMFSVMHPPFLWWWEILVILDHQPWGMLWSHIPTHISFLCVFILHFHRFWLVLVHPFPSCNREHRHWISRYIIRLNW